jgi:hypothetical protein
MFRVPQPLRSGVPTADDGDLRALEQGRVSHQVKYRWRIGEFGQQDWVIGVVAGDDPVPGIAFAPGEIRCHACVALTQRLASAGFARNAGSGPLASFGLERGRRTPETLDQSRDAPGTQPRRV